MEELFNKEKMEKTIKKAKRQSLWKTVFLTTGILLIIGICGSFLNENITLYFQSVVSNANASLEEISGANEFVANKENFPGILGGKEYYKTYKLIEGKVVYTGEKGYGYGLFRNEWLNRSGMQSELIVSESGSEDDLSLQRYNYLGQREMVFFYPFVDYKNVRNDLAWLDELRDDQVFEVALSFDKGYGVDEAINKLPKDVTKTWLWVKDVEENPDEVRNYLVDEKGNLTPLGYSVRSEHNVYGFPLITPNGDKVDMPGEQFIIDISTGKKLRTSWQWEFNRLYDTIGGEDGLSQNDLVIYGAVVTGSKETLASLHDLEFIRASSIGVITDKY